MHVSGVDKCYEAIHSRVRRNEEGGVMGGVFCFMWHYFTQMAFLVRGYGNQTQGSKGVSCVDV